jgi:small redox-active disulfide protein 2
MRKIQILGTGCPKCAKLAEQTAEAIKALGTDDEIVKVKDIQEIMKFGVMMTPGLAIDGQVKFSGKVPTVEELKRILAE